MTMKRILALALAVLMLSSLAACGQEPQSTQPSATTTAPLTATAEYTVQVVDALGNPYTAGVIVRILKDGQQVAMQVVDENGSVTKTLDRGNYTVELMFTNDTVTYVYDTAAAALSPEKTSLEISLARTLSGQSTQLYHKDSALEALHVEVACTQAPLKAGRRNYFLFIPQEAGTYRFSVVGAVEGMGYYGSPFYMSDASMLPVENNSFVTSIRADMVSHGTGTDVMVIGIDPGTASECFLVIERTGDPAWSPEDEPYVVYEPTVTLAPYTLPEGKSTLDFDLTAATDKYKLVLSQADGFYHLNDANGPLVLVKLGVDSKYMSCYQTVLTKTGVRAYFYDESGKFLRREKYDECLRSYFAVMDQKAGLYPLTEDLKYIIQTHGDYNGWWDLTSETSIFQDDSGNPLASINPEIAWLFMCCYLAQ